MALWRDPLDELIEDLERALPAQAGNTNFEQLPPLEGVQLLVHAVLYGTPENRARAEQDPRVQAVLAYHARLGRRLDEERRRHSPPSEIAPGRAETT